MKSTYLKYFFLLWLIILLTFDVHGQQDISIADYIPFRITEKVSLLPAPSLSYKPETKWSFGLGIIGSYTPDKNKAINISTAQLDIVYTTNKQFIIDLDHYFLINNRKWIISGSNSFYKYPELFYSQRSVNDSETIEYKRLEFDNKVLLNIKGYWYVGIVHRLQYIRSVEYLSDGLFANEKPTGYQGGISNGLGIGLQFDHRINVLNPKTGGAFFKLNTRLFSSIIGSQFEFLRIEADYRKYIKIGQKHNLAFQAFGIFNQGDPPFKLTGQLGGSNIMRGYYLGRYRNRQMMAFQAELRLAIYKRLGMTAFASIGNVASNIAQLTQNSPKTACGLGIRYMLDKKNQANLRLDFAVGQRSHGIYFGYGEAF